MQEKDQQRQPALEGTTLDPSHQTNRGQVEPGRGENRGQTHHNGEQPAQTGGDHR